jgi:hypothetical protein
MYYVPHALLLKQFMLLRSGNASFTKGSMVNIPRYLNFYIYFKSVLVSPLSIFVTKIQKQLR